MGGSGSGRWTYHDKKRTVEECWAMGVSDVARVIGCKEPRTGLRILTADQAGVGEKDVACALLARSR